MMLLGQHPLPLQSNGQIVLPSTLRQPLVERGAVLTCGMDHNVLILTKSAFQKLAVKLAATSMTDPLARSLNRLVLGNAVEIGVNEQGSFQIPGALANFAGLDKQVVLVGQGEYLELWSAGAWEQQREQLAQVLDDQHGFEKFNVSLA